MINRRFKDSGSKPFLAYFILAFGFVGLSIYMFSKTEYAEYLFAHSALLLIGKLSETRRTEFLKICFGVIKLKKIRLIENFICSLPFLLFLLYKQLYLTAILLFVLTTFLALVSFRTTINFTTWTPFSKKPFEFTSGYRKTFYLIFIAYALAIISISVNNFNLGVAAMLLVFATTLTYYTKPENEYYVWIFNLNPNGFLSSKIKTALLFSTLLALPVAVIISIFYPQNIGIISLFFLIGLGFLISVIVSKYDAYPNEINIKQGFILSLCIWFPPILVIIFPYLFKKSKNNLNNLLK